MYAVHPQASDSGQSGEDFVARIAAGDRRAEEQFVRTYANGVRVLVRRHCRPGDAIVDDLVQEVLSRVLERLRAGAIRNVTALPAYIQTTIVHAASAEYRARRLVEPIEVIESLAGESTPPEELHTERLRQTLQSLLAELPQPRDRELLRRFYLQDESKEEVCLALGIDDAHFRRVMFRARARFRVLLEQAGLGDAR
jgi:RNA polymerase sigma-70 factor (ECF subfamily)